MFLNLGKQDRVTLPIAIIGLIVVFICQNLGAVLFFGALSLYVAAQPEVGTDAIDQFMSNPDFSLINMDSNLGLLLMIIPFALAMISLYFWVVKIHDRPFTSLITATKRIDFKRIFSGFAIWLFFCLVIELAMYITTGNIITFEFDAVNFTILLLIAIFVLPIQTSFEELYLRGYVMQISTKISSYRWVPIVISTIIFAALHGANPEVGKYGMAPMMMYYIVAGLMLAIMTIMDDRLELALGVHWATNFFGTVFVNYESSALQTYSLINTGESNPYLVTLIWAVCGVVFLLICSKIYKWKSFKLLFEKYTNESIA